MPVAVISTLLGLVLVGVAVIFMQRRQEEAAAEEHWGTNDVQAGNADSTPLAGSSTTAQL